MKKFLKLITASFIAVVSLFSIVGCNNSDIDKPPLTSSVCNVQVSENPYSDPISFKDSKNYYYMFYLGNIKDVPLQTGVDVFKYEGIDYSYSFTLETSTTASIEQQVTTAVEHCTEWTSSWSLKLSKNVGASVNILNIINLSSNFGLERGYSKSNKTTDRITATESYRKAEISSHTSSTTFSVSFDNSYKEGYYRYILMGELKIYGAVIYDFINGGYSLMNYPVLVASYYSLNYDADSAQFNNYTYTTIPFDLDENYIINLPTPTDSIEDVDISDLPSEVIPTEAINIDFKRESCKLNNGFDPASSGNKKNELAHSKFNLLELVLDNTIKSSNGKYSIINNLQPKLYLRVLQNPNNLPVGSHIGSVNWTIHYVNNNTYNNAVLGTNITSKIGKGAYYVKVNYTDGSFNEFNEVNILNGNAKDNLLSLNIDFNSGKKLKSVEVVCVYQLYYDYMAHILNWGGTKCRADWRCSTTLNFN